MSIAASAVLSSLPVPGLRKPRSSAPMRQEPAAHTPTRRWPFPPAPKPISSLDDVRKLSSSQIVSRKDMLFDVLMVAAWGVAIPALMWLGAAAGF